MQLHPWIGSGVVAGFIAFSRHLYRSCVPHAPHMYCPAGKELEGFIPKSLKDFEELGKLVAAKHLLPHARAAPASYKAAIKSLLKVALATMAAQEVKDLETCVAGGCRCACWAVCCAVLCCACASCSDVHQSPPLNAQCCSLPSPPAQPCRPPPVPPHAAIGKHSLQQGPIHLSPPLAALPCPLPTPLTCCPALPSPCPCPCTPYLPLPCRNPVGQDQGGEGGGGGGEQEGAEAGDAQRGPRWRLGRCASVLACAWRRRSAGGCGCDFLAVICSPSSSSTAVMPVRLCARPALAAARTALSPTAPMRPQWTVLRCASRPSSYSALRAQAWTTTSTATREMETTLISCRQKKGRIETQLASDASRQICDARGASRAGCQLRLPSSAAPPPHPIDHMHAPSCRAGWQPPANPAACPQAPLAPPSSSDWRRGCWRVVENCGTDPKSQCCDRHALAVFGKLSGRRVGKQRRGGEMQRHNGGKIDRSSEWHRGVKCTASNGTRVGRETTGWEEGEQAHPQCWQVLSGLGCGVRRAQADCQVTLIPTPGAAAASGHTRPDTGVGRWVRPQRKTGGHTAWRETRETIECR